MFGMDDEFDGNKSKGIQLSDLYNGRGLAYYHSSKYKEALEDFDKAISLSEQESSKGEGNSNTWSYYSNKGLALYYQQQYEECINYITRAISIRNNVINDPRIYTTRAAAYQLLGKEHEALRDRKRALKLDEKTPLAVFPYEIPFELVVMVFEFLDKNSLVRCMLTCKLWKNLILSNPELCKILGIQQSSSPSPLSNSLMGALALLDCLDSTENQSRNTRKSC